ncbi:Protein yellow [Pseudolycoriella hygida]|uniref:Protein yellow n=1 Tax=Pseudolycoriella hygida TaxID=35572 RepID=A0A9Q0NH95_9DIPT|nr:Protein yellow [Pseudolycoriella hygida]
MRRYLRTILLVLLCTVIAIECIKLEEKYCWQQLEYAWPSESVKEQAIQSGKYKVEDNLPLGLDVWKDKLFITVPRWKSGVASSLNYVTISDEKTPILHPYPSWEANTLPDGVQSQSEATAGGRAAAPKAVQSNVGALSNSSIISTFRIRVDECDRLWVMDTGLADILGNPMQIMPPALVIFDLRTNELIRRYPLPDDHVKEDTFFANVIVDVGKKDDCDNAYAYVPDLGAYGLVVYSFKENKSWRVKHNFFHFDPLSGDYNIGGVNFQWTDGIFGLALGRAETDGSRKVYFHALSSTKEFEVPNRVLQNESYSTGSDAYFDYKLVGDRGSNGQSSAEFFDDEAGVLFYTQVNKDGVGCWNAKKPYNPDTQGLVDSDSDALVFPNDLKVDANRNLWVLSDRMPAFLYKSLNYTEFNYRILKGKVDDLILGTPCV